MATANFDDNYQRERARELYAKHIIAVSASCLRRCDNTLQSRHNIADISNPGFTLFL